MPVALALSLLSPPGYWSQDLCHKRKDSNLVECVTKIHLNAYIETIPLKSNNKVLQRFAYLQGD